MKGIGPWSKAAVAQSSELINSRVWLDGPYGRLSIDPAQYSHCVFVVGGIGVTPFLSLMEELLALPKERQPHIEFIWTMRELALLQHFEVKLNRFAELGANVSYHVTSTSKDRGGSVDTGSFELVSQLEHSESAMNLVPTKSKARPNLAAIFTRVADHYGINHNTHYNAERTGCALLCCGPPALVSAVQHAAGLVSMISQMPIDIHQEVFEF
eukprot:COSAG02_NODE_5374_length_4389_cov_3.643590_2_plen_212_part_00